MTKQGSKQFAIWAFGGLAFAGLVGLIAAWATNRTVTDKQHRSVDDQTFFERDITNENCPICYKRLFNPCNPKKNKKNRQQEILDLDCGHIFHLDCLNRCLQQLTMETGTPCCPVCGEA